MSSAASISGVRVEGRTQMATRPSRLTVRCQASKDTSTRRQLLGTGLLFAAGVVSPAAKADLVEDLLAKTEANKALNDKRRLATSYANFARSRTLADGTCEFPNNFFGCDIEAIAGNVKYITEDMKIECEGIAPGKCNSKPNMFNVAP